jgi:nanoRNase/pAp phosphatase (c-di-AMP/oligoRNAs hydrolase)
LKSFLSRFHPSRLLLLCHENTDIDAMASALALYFSLPKQFRCTIGVPEHANQSSQQLCQNLKTLFSIKPEPEKFDALIILDFNSPIRAAVLQDQLRHFKKPVLVIDHHPKTQDSFKTPFSVLEPDALSTASLILDELEKSGFLIPKKAWLALAAGMVSDSVDLVLADSALLQKTALCLEKTGYTIQQIRQLYAMPEDFSERIAKLKGLHRVRLYELNGFLVAVSHANFFESQIAMALLAAGADISFVAGLEKKSLACRMACRASQPVLNKNRLDLARDVCTKLSLSFGGQGNGHAGAASFYAFHAEPEMVLQSSLELLLDFFRKKGKELEFREII